MLHVTKLLHSRVGPSLLCALSSFMQVYTLGKERCCAMSLLLMSGSALFDAGRG